MDNNLSILLSVEYIYTQYLHDTSKYGFALNELKLKNHENKIRMDEIIDEFELTCSPPTLTVLLPEACKKIVELVIKTYKTQNYDEFLSFTIGTKTHILWV